MKQSLDSCQQSFELADSDSSAESWLSATDALELAQLKLLRSITALHVDDDTDHSRFV